MAVAAAKFLVTSKANPNDAYPTVATTFASECLVKVREIAKCGA